MSLSKDLVKTRHKLSDRSLAEKDPHARAPFAPSESDGADGWWIQG